MVSSKFQTLLIIAWAILISGCQISKQAPKPTAEVVDPDIVVMPGLSEKQSTGVAMGVKPMTFEELNSCAQKVDHYDKAAIQQHSEGKRLDVVREEIDKQNKGLELDRAKVDPKIIKQVTDFNKRLEDTQALVRQFNSDIEKFNSQNGALTLENNEFNTNCANRAYRQSDYLKLPSELRTSIAIKSKLSDIPLIEQGASSAGGTKKTLHIGSKAAH